MDIEGIHISNNAESKDGIEGLTFSEKESPTLMNKKYTVIQSKKIAYIEEGWSAYSIYSWKPNLFLFMEKYH